MSYRLTKKAESDLAALIDFSLERFGSDTALRHVDKLERSIAALDRGEFAGELRVLRIYHGAREPL